MRHNVKVAACPPGALHVVHGVAPGSNEGFEVPSHPDRRWVHFPSVEAFGHLRVSDQERERAAQQLREHFAAGRLTGDELSERVQQAYAARTEQQLYALLADLPRLPVSRQEQKAELVARRAELQRRLFQQAGASVVPFVICVVIWLASGANGGFWPIWVAIFPAIMLLRNGWHLYGPAPDLERVERELERRARRRADHPRRPGRT
jgi:hypothetical protein